MLQEFQPSSEHDSSILDIEDQQLVEELTPQEEALLIQEKFAQVSLDELCQKYKEQGIHLSDLTMTRYKNLMINPSKSLVPVLPKIDFQLNLKSIQSNQPSRVNLIQNNRNQFFNIKEIHYLKMGLINMVEKNQHEKYKSALFGSQSQTQIKRARFVSIDQSLYPISQKSIKIQSMNASSSRISEINYGQPEISNEIQYQLFHNKQQLLQNFKQLEQSINKEVELRKKPPIQLHLRKKIPSIKSYPKKIGLEQIIDHPPPPSNNQKENNIQVIRQSDVISAYYVHWLEKEQNQWRPTMREGHSFTNIGNKIYCYGGINSKKLNDLYYYDTIFQKWQLVNQTGEIPLYGRNNHSANVYKKLLYIFGGERYYDSTLRIRECYNDFRCFNSENDEWRLIKLNGEVIEPRRAHQSVFVGKSLIIIGGINSKNQYKNDIYYIDMQYSRVSQCQTLQNPFPNGIAFFTATAVYNADNKPTLFRPSQERESKNNFKVPWIREEGIYIIGGEDATGQYIEGVHILKTSQKPLDWIKPEIRGVGPQSRTKHIALYQETINILIVYGGINYKSEFLDDVFVLRVDNLCWCQVQLCGLPRHPRAGHAAAIDDKKILIFGGYNLDGFVTGEVQYLDVDSRSALQLHQQIQEAINRDRHKDLLLREELARRYIEKLHQKVENLQFKSQEHYGYKNKLMIDSQKGSIKNLKQKLRFEQETSMFDIPEKPSKKESH